MRNFLDLQHELQSELPNIAFRFHEPLHKHTSFRIGGNAEVMAFPKTTAELSSILYLSNQLGVNTTILGAGTNILAPDSGVDGIVICLKDCLDGMEQLDATHIRVMAGVTMTRAAIFAANLGLSGLEFAHGIPGTVGGGVYMNAGAYGGEMCQVVDRVEVIDFTGDTRFLNNEQMVFGYRNSILESSDLIAVSATFCLEPKPQDEIRATMKDLMKRRSASQPLDMPSAGSAFKRPVGGYAAALIEEAGLKGYSVGGAAISTKHAGFAVNLGYATSEDVKKLLQDVSDIVYEKSGIRLEPEIRIW